MKFMGLMKRWDVREENLSLKVSLSKAAVLQKLALDVNHRGLKKHLIKTLQTLRILGSTYLTRLNRDGQIFAFQP